MCPDQQDEARGSGGQRPASSVRDERRAAALRANLQRRKAQTRGRADAAAEPKPETLEGENSGPD